MDGCLKKTQIQESLASLPAFHDKDDEDNHSLIGLNQLNIQNYVTKMNGRVKWIKMLIQS